MNTRTTELSVLMPVHNGEQHLEEAIGSVLGQTFEDFEFLVIDDGSTDSSPDIIAEHAALDRRITPLRLPGNQGVAEALNYGLARVETPIVARMDGDDVSLPNRFMTQIEAMRADVSIGVLGARTTFINDQGDPAPQLDWPQPTSHNEVAWRLLFGSPICHPAVMMRTDLVRAAGAYDPAFPNEDMELWTRMVFLGAVQNLDAALLEYRMTQPVHAEKLRSWQPHVANVGQRYAERILGSAIDTQIFEATRVNHATGEPPSDLNELELLAVARLLRDLHQQMHAEGPFRGEGDGRPLQLLEQDLQRLAGRLRRH